MNNYDNKYDGERGTASDLLIHYFKTLFQANGLSWNGDNESEIKALIEAIIQASNLERGKNE